MTFEVPDSRVSDIDVLKRQLNDLFNIIVLKHNIQNTDVSSSGSLRNAFSGDWGSEQDSADYAYILRHECVNNNRDVDVW